MSIPFLDIDIPICRDFIAFDEAKLGREMVYEELVSYLKRHFDFAEHRCAVILETLGRYPKEVGKL